MPEKGERLVLRREPGILRSQYSLWTEGREWLGSSLRPGFVQREIALSSGAKSYRLLPTASFGRGWRMLAPKTGEMARILHDGLGRSRIEVYRRVDTELVPSIKTDLEALQRTLGSVDRTLQNADTTLKNADNSLFGPNAPAQHELRDALTEFTRAARSLRVFLDYIERHPESPIRGKLEDKGGAK